MTRERDRYPRMTLRDRFEELVDWLRGHRLVVLVLLLLATWVIVQVISPPRSARPQDLRVGDCLFVRTGSANELGPGTRPIGDPPSVRASLMAGSAEPASCGGSHGHEVSAIVEIVQLAVDPGLPSYDKACVEAFGPYVGRVTGSIYHTFAVMPTQKQLDAGVHRAICLVARTDGQWMTHPARGSGE